MLAHSMKTKVPILMYHSVSRYAAPKFRQFAVSPALFAAQMAYLHEHAYTPMTVGYYVNTLSQGRSASAPLPQRPVILTFDDGFADFFTEAFPILKQHDFTATLYITTAFINGTSRWLEREGEASRQMLTWDQLREINAWGIECGSHSHSHCQLDTVPHFTAYDEIRQSKRILESHLGKEVASFAYPFGYHTAVVRSQVQAAGYTSACAVGHRMSTENTNPFALTRLIVKGNTDINAFDVLLNGPGPSLASNIHVFYARARTPIWQLIRRSSALVARNHSGGSIQ